MNHRKKIGIIADSLNNEKTGIGQYLFNLLRYIAKLDKENEYFLINNKNESCGVYTNNFKLKVIDKTMPSIFSGPHPWYLTLPCKIKNSNFDLIFNPSQIPTFFRFNSPYIVTVHDLIPLYMPEVCWKWKKYIYRLFLPRTLKNANKIIAISNSTKEELKKYLKIPEHKIKVIYSGVNNSLIPLQKKDTAIVKKKYNLSFPFILYVGTVELRKNVSGIIKAWHIVKKRSSFKHKLVIVGKNGIGYKDIINTINRLNLKDEIILTNYISNQDVIKLYNEADLFVFPSFAEGFGLPPLEAMVYGVPVIVSDIPAISEAVGDVGIKVNPYNTNELADKISEVLYNNQLREELSQKGLKRAELFNWERCAQNTLDVFNEILAE